MLRLAPWQFVRLQAGRSVKQTAHARGFRDQYYFSRLFKRKMGLAPSGYAGET
jgi:AraC-like DNA-binding protein